MVRVTDNIPSSDNLHMIRERLQCQHNINIKGKFCKEPNNVNILINENDTLVNLNINNGDILYLFPEKDFIRKIIDADNSCLFNSIWYLINNDDTFEGNNYRKLISQYIQNDSETYSEEILGKSPKLYSEWLLKLTAWGGEIEMNILSKILNIEIVAVDIETGLLYKYGELFNYNQRIYVLYDGIHYDALYRGKDDKCKKEERITIFKPETKEYDEYCIKELSKKLKDQKKFINLEGCEIKCLICNIGLHGQKEAREHANITGHQNFDQF